MVKTIEFKDYDATCLAKTYTGPKCTLLIDQGSEDNFLKQGQLLPENLVKSVNETNNSVSVDLRHQNVAHFFIFKLNFELN
jgi:S-formylglutathione hydrolase